MKLLVLPEHLWLEIQVKANFVVRPMLDSFRCSASPTPLRGWKLAATEPNFSWSTDVVATVPSVNAKALKHEDLECEVPLAWCCCHGSASTQMHLAQAVMGMISVKRQIKAVGSVLLRMVGATSG